MTLADRRLIVAQIPGSNCCRVQVGRRKEAILGTPAEILETINPIARHPAPIIWRALGVEESNP